VDDVAAEWAKTALVLITRGADGVSIFQGENRWDVPSRKINVVDTVGAGDTFCANMLGQLSDLDALGSDAFDRLTNLSDEAWREIVHTAGIAASITCERAGCEPPTKPELEEVLASI
jgi:fructokinase